MPQIAGSSTSTGSTGGSGSLFSFDNIYGTLTTYIQTEYQTMADAIGNPAVSGKVAEIVVDQHP